MIKQYKLRFYNFRLVVFLLAISFIGIHLVGTAADYLRTRQLLGVIIGVVFMLTLSLMDYSWLLNFQWIMYGFNIVMLLAVRFFGSSANGAARWVDLGFIRFQPTELSKIIIILFFAKFFMDHEDDLNTLKTLAQSAVLLVIPLMLIYVQPDMKNTITVVILFCILIYIAGLQSIDTDVYEAADLDGATGFKRFSKITFPLLAPSFTINMVLSAKGYLMVYDQIMAMTDGGPGTATTSIAVLIYKKGFGGGQFAYQSANAVVLFIVVVLISVLQLRILEKREEKLG